MDRNEKAILWLDNFDFATYSKKGKLLKLVANAGDFLDWEVVVRIKDKIEKILTPEESQILYREVGENFADKVIEKLNSLGISAITIESIDYPKSLRNIDTPPFVIYYKGNIKLMKDDCFGIVGTRHITSYGKMATEKFCHGLVDAGYVIVSGLASGVDTCAHQNALNYHGQTIAVLAGGIDEIYPATNTELAKKIVESGGLVLSETRPLRRAEAYMFPIRNRIIAGLSSGILVVEAGEKSGALHTKNYALDYGKDVFAVPGSVFSIASVGTNRMISNGQAKAVCDIRDIIGDRKLRDVTFDKTCENVSMDEQVVIELLRSGEKTFQELVDLSHIETKRLNSLLTMLTIRGIIKKLAGNVYFLK